VINRSLGALLFVSTAIELLVFFRPTFWLGDAALSLVVDLAVQTVLWAGLPLLWLGAVAYRRGSLVGLARPPARAWQWTALLVAAALPVALLATRIPSIHGAYPRLADARVQPWLLVPSTLAFAGYGLAWELFFRGFLLLGLKAHVGRWAILLQAVPCGLMHVGKPTFELLAAFPAALVFGVIAYRAGSILPGWLLHMLVALAVNLGCVFWPLG
jgi:membrane protease YdiL (CAAX protease family)